MRRAILASIVAVAGCLVAAAAASGAYLEGGKDATSSQTDIRPSPPPGMLMPDNPIIRLVRRLEVSPGHTYRGLTVFLVETRRVEDATDYLSAEEATRRGTLQITEKGGGSVPILLARNNGDGPVLLLAGGLVTGGKQNRTLRDDVLLAPHSGRVELPVYCIEKGRWSGGTSRFEGEGSVAALGVRTAAVQNLAQEQVWASVHSYREKLPGAAPTEDLDAIQNAEPVQRKLKGYREAFADYWGPKAVGMVVARGRRVVGADIFCNPEVFRKHRRRLLESYALDCIAGPAELKERPPGGVRDDAERFLRSALQAKFTWRATPGQGRLLDAWTKVSRGTALVKDGAVVHLCLVRPSPMPEPLGRIQRPPRMEQHIR
ncbi:MAG: hypothetical protein J7M08_08860 [Planctomycetes bacterium]|nr:hypothetical protein [Planctomycetota bacterium]